MHKMQTPKYLLMTYTCTDPVQKLFGAASCFNTTSCYFLHTLAQLLALH